MRKVFWINSSVKAVAGLRVYCINRSINRVPDRIYIQDGTVLLLFDGKIYQHCTRYSGFDIKKILKFAVKCKFISELDMQKHLDFDKLNELKRVTNYEVKTLHELAEKYHFKLVGECRTGLES